jgi:SAM-dependent methyltransferase
MVKNYGTIKSILFFSYSFFPIVCFSAPFIEGTIVKDELERKVLDSEIKTLERKIAGLKKTTHEGHATLGSIFNSKDPATDHPLFELLEENTRKELHKIPIIYSEQTINYESASGMHTEVCEERESYPYTEVLQVLKNIVKVDTQKFILEKEETLNSMKKRRSKIEQKIKKSILETFSDKVVQEEAFQMLENLSKDYHLGSVDSFEKYYKPSLVDVSNRKQGSSHQGVRDFGQQVNLENKLTHSFLDHVAKSEGVALDIGCGYGINTLRALERGAEVWATDLDPQNLRVLVTHTPEKDLKKLKLSLGKFPESGNHIPENSMSSVLLSHVAHYYSPEEEKSAFKRVREILKPNGKFFLQALTYHAEPYSSRKNRARRDTAKLRMSEVKRGNPNEALDKDFPLHLGDNELAPHPQHKILLRKYLEANGFQVEGAEHFKFDDTTEWNKEAEIKSAKQSPTTSPKKVSKMLPVVGVIATKIKED